jgi:hypothetical protein
MAKSRKGGWPEKNPETSSFPALTTPLSTTAAPAEPGPGVYDIVPDNASPGNPVGYSGMEGGKKKGRKG